ncbi:MAG: 50S ribosomal protein L29 [Anaplasmataceae bacterium]|nr:50S ribosomal protein L29 [Anaplasmataceae bacterium]
MKRKDIEALQSKSATELTKELGEARTQLEQLRFELYAGKVKNVLQIREQRKLIARLLTFIKQAK